MVIIKKTLDDVNYSLPFQAATCLQALFFLKGRFAVGKSKNSLNKKGLGKSSFYSLNKPDFELLDVLFT